MNSSAITELDNEENRAEFLKLAHTMKAAGPFIEGLYYYDKNVGVVGTYTNIDSSFDGTKQDWYNGAIEHPGDIFWSKAYISDTNGMKSVTGARAIMRGKEVIGVIAVDLNLSRLNERMSSTTIGHTGRPFVLKENGELFISDYANQIGDDWSDRT